MVIRTRDFLIASGFAKQNKKMPRMKNNHKTVPQNMDTGCTQLLFSDCKIPSILAWNVSAVVSKAADKKNRLRKL